VNIENCALDTGLAGLLNYPGINTFNVQYTIINIQWSTDNIQFPVFNTHHGERTQQRKEIIIIASQILLKKDNNVGFALPG